MVVIIDFHHIFPDVQKRDRSAFEDDVAKMIGYYLYREFFIDTGIYSLENRLLGKYCRRHMDISTHCRSIGEVAWQHRYRRSIIRIRNQDAYAILLKEASYD